MFNFEFSRRGMFEFQKYNMCFKHVKSSMFKFKCCEWQKVFPIKAVKVSCSIFKCLKSLMSTFECEKRGVRISNT